MPKRFRFSASLKAGAISELPHIARRAEDLGFSAVTLPDHLDDQPAPLLGLCSAAIATSTLRVMPLVLANDFRHPVILAKELATLDAISGGRLEFGLGAGWMKDDYEYSGITHDNPGKRIDRLRESVTIVRSLLNQGSVSFEGAHYRVDGSLNEPAPAQHDGVPLLLAGGKKKMLTLAGELADIVGINPGLGSGVIDQRAGRDSTSAQTTLKLEWVKQAAGQRFDDLELQTRVHLAMIADDRHKIASDLAPVLGLSADEALESPHCLVGTVDQCIETIRRWRQRWGISYVSINGDVMEQFAPVVDALAGT